MNLENLTHYEQATLVLSALVLYTSFALLAQSRLLNLINIFAWQGTLLAATAALVAHVSTQPHLYISALLTLFLKALLIPWILRSQVLNLNLHRETESLTLPTLTLLGGVGVVVFSYHVVLPVEQLLTFQVMRNTIAVSLAVVLLSMLLIISRRQAVSQVVGFMAMENGLFFAAVASTYGMPMVVELGVAFDVLVAAILFGVFFFHINENLDSLDVDQMNRLREVDE
ncbi:MAG: formate hydrogenlyase [Beggiatoa sp. IS2]|nr:MAG: formate hydrogenlyase [Beggiatoa sp. IS2]